MTDDMSDLGRRARSRIAVRLLPFVFLMYVICYVDRTNVSFANLRMSVELGFSDRVYGLGVGMFFIGYVFLEIPGALIVERWSARKWLARIMISWGIATVFSAFVRTPAQFYTARFSLESQRRVSFPGSSSTSHTGSDKRIGPKRSHPFTLRSLRRRLWVRYLRRGCWGFTGRGSADGAGYSSLKELGRSFWASSQSSF